MELLLYSYIIIIVYLLFKYSKSKTLYIFSPYIIIYLNFVFNDIVPFLLFYPDIPENLQYTTFTALLRLQSISSFYHFTVEETKTWGS